MRKTATKKLKRSHDAFRRLALLSLICGAVAWGQPSLGIAQMYSIETLGLTSGEHTRDDDFRSSLVSDLNEAGQAIGSSNRYSGSEYRGSSAWLYDSGTTAEIGLTGVDHTQNDGYRYSAVNDIDEAGQVIGNSTRYNGSAFHGQSVWRYSAGTTTDIGFTGSEHTRNDGYRYSTVRSINQSGQVIGDSNRYNFLSSHGQSAWLFSNGTTNEIGLTGSQHTETGGARFSTVRGLNEAGQVIGISSRYDGLSGLGNSAWRYSGGTTSEIGLTGSQHTRTDGFRSSAVSRLNEAGQVIGTSIRFDGSAIRGGSAWRFDNGTTTEIGLIGAQHTRTDGERNSSVTDLNEAGQVIGVSTRYDGSLWRGQSAWRHSGGTTSEIGLTSSQHTRTDGFRTSVASDLNDAGQAIGYTHRYNGNQFLGESAWIHNGDMTTEIGLADGDHSASDGYRVSSATNLNATGLVAGYSDRFNAADENAGRTAWLYDANTNQTHSFLLSVQASTGYAASFVGYLGDDGLVLGQYSLFDSQSALLGERAFMFTVAAGVTDLGSVVDGSFVDWESLGSTVRANSAGMIIGYGTLRDGNNMPYLLRPTAVPEPSGGVFLALCGLLMATSRRHRSPQTPTGNAVKHFDRRH
jgi:environmental stress-induced protein Ves